MTAPVDVLAVIDAQASFLNGLRREFGKAISDEQDAGQYTHRAPDEITLLDLNHTVTQLRDARFRVRGLIEAVNKAASHCTCNQYRGGHLMTCHIPGLLVALESCGQVSP